MNQRHQNHPMIKLIKNTANNVIITVTENVTLTNPVFLFDLTYNSSSNNSYQFIADNISSATTRYDQFIIQNQISGITEQGWFTYKVYEQESTTNMNPLLATSLVEQGLCLVSGSTQLNYVTDSGQTNYNYYRSA